MSSVRILVTPEGFAPEEVRKAWVGLEIPVATDAEIRQDPPSSFRVGRANISGYLVLRSKAVEVLKLADRHEAAEFWARVPGRYLEFSQRVCALVA